MSKYHIVLTPEEVQLFGKIDLRDDLPIGVDEHEIYQNNRAPILALLKSLRDRDAIPHHRISYFTDPAYKAGRLKGSRKDIFERNGNVGAEIYEHPSFKQHLRYFVFGADLPESAIAAFEKEVSNPKWISGSDALDLGRKAIRISRQFSIPKKNAADGFFKLALDMGISFSQASVIEGIVRRSSLK